MISDSIFSPWSPSTPFPQISTPWHDPYYHQGRRSLKILMVGHGGNSAASYLDDPTSPIPSGCAIIILFKGVPVHQLSWLALEELKPDKNPLLTLYPPTLWEKITSVKDARKKSKVRKGKKTFWHENMVQIKKFLDSRKKITSVKDARKKNVKLEREIKQFNLKIWFKSLSL